jgi:hypothetical protein
VSNLQQAYKSDPEKPLVQAELTLVDMILTQEAFVVRDVKRVTDSLFGLCTEGNKVQCWSYDEQYKQQQLMQAQQQELH